MSTSRFARRGALIRCLVSCALCMALVPGAFASWVEFADGTATRLVAAESLGASDIEEKDYAWGDVDKDGDTDLVVVRKTPFTSSGKRVNVLFINENGVLTDRSEDFTWVSDVSGDEGFNTPTNDRDVALVDVDRDGWLDIVTATTLSDGDPKYLGHPRIYMNLRCSGSCAGTEDWLGFRYEEARIPTMLSHSGQAGHNPRFCAVTAGDLNNDTYPDLYFGDYDSGGGQASGADFNDKLLINQGASNPGYFFDDTFDNFPGTISIPGTDPQEFEISAFGAADALVDINGDSRLDIVKRTSLNAPTYVGIAYNKPGDDGFFDDYEVAIQNSPYHISAGDLNNDDKMDIVVTDDGSDRYLLNQGTGGDARADFVSYTFDFNNTSGGDDSNDDGFGSNSLVVDLDNDGWNDVLIADVDVDISGCQRRLHIYRNLGGNPGDQVTLEEQVEGNNCASIWGNPSSCIVASIPADKLEGVHDMAVFDLDGNGSKDMILGRCDGTSVYMNQLAVAPAGGTPDGDSIDGQQLMIEKNVEVNVRLTMTWGESCVIDDTDYAIYEGQIGDFSSHTDKFCSTGGATTQDFFAPFGNAYFLVVPHNGIVEGSYGNATAGPRTQGDGTCFSQNVGTCE